MEEKIDLTKIKKYCRIDYDDDDDLLLVMYQATLQEMQELIESFDKTKMTPRQELIVMISVKSLYDDRDKYAKDQELLKTAVSSMLLKEVYKGA